MKLFSQYEYLKQNRLSDVIRLISVLGVDENYSFRKNEALTTTLNGKPKSGKDWFEIAEEHPEFFKFNVAGDTVVLLFRAMVKQHENGKRDPLTIDQTQKIIDQAISLHDKQIARLQKNSFLMPIITAVIASLTTGLVAYLTLKSNNESIKKIDTKVENIIGILQNKSLKQNVINPTLKIENQLKVTKQKVSDSIENQKKSR